MSQPEIILIDDDLKSQSFVDFILESLIAYFKKFQVSVSEAIEKSEKSVKKWEEEEKMGKAYGFAQLHKRMASGLRSFKADLEKNRNNPAYVHKDVSGYIDVLQNNLFHTKYFITDEETKKKMDKIHDELAMLIYILDDIEIVP